MSFIEAIQPSGGRHCRWWRNIHTHIEAMPSRRMMHRSPSGYSQGLLERGATDPLRAASGERPDAERFLLAPADHAAKAGLTEICGLGSMARMR
jgi:hypothetical protein